MSSLEGRHTAVTGAGTGIGAAIARALADEEARAALASDSPMGRFIEPGEVARAVLWPCGPGSDAVTGQSVSVSGGATW